MSLEDISHEFESQERNAFIADYAMEIEKLRADLATERTAREALERERDEARAAAQVLTESGVRGHEAVCALTKERDGLAAMQVELLKVIEPLFEGYRPNLIDVAGVIRTMNGAEILAARDASLTAPLERRALQLERAARPLVDLIQRERKSASRGFHPDNNWFDLTAYEGVGEPIKVSYFLDLEAALASTPREGTEEKRNG